MSAHNNIVIFDTTLRDGEQSPGASMNSEEKIRVAKALERMNVDVIEAGFAIASQGDFDAVKAVATTVQNSRICSLSRASVGDIERAAEALKPANASRIHTFIATSPIHMKYKLQMDPDQVIDKAVSAIKHARNLVEDVEFSCEDAGRSQFEFLCQIIEKAIDAGASTINIPDTVGYAIPSQFGNLIKRLIETIPNADKAIFSVHCHNDLGLATANSLSALQNGARQVECTINGLGERAGNASLEEIVMAIETRSDLFELSSNIQTKEIVPSSRLVSTITGFSVQPNKAIVGANAFAHEAGIHQDGVIKHRETYEIMRAEDVGWKHNRMVLGKHSGRSAFKARLEELGISLSSQTELNEAFAQFKALADKKQEIFDEDLLALFSARELINEKYQFKSLQSSLLTGQTPKAKVTILIDGVSKEAEAEGSGPVDAAFKAIETIANSGAYLQLYNVNAITAGTDSQGDVTVRLEKKGRVVNGLGADTDIVQASIKAYLNALNLLDSNVKRAHPHSV